MASAVASVSGQPPTGPDERLKTRRKSSKSALRVAHSIRLNCRRQNLRPTRPFAPSIATRRGWPPPRKEPKVQPLPRPTGGDRSAPEPSVFQSTSKALAVSRAARRSIWDARHERARSSSTRPTYAAHRQKGHARPASETAWRQDCRYPHDRQLSESQRLAPERCNRRCRADGRIR